MITQDNLLIDKSVIKLSAFMIEFRRLLPVMDIILHYICKNRLFWELTELSLTSTHPHYHWAGVGLKQGLCQGIFYLAFGVRYSRANNVYNSSFKSNGAVEH